MVACLPTRKFFAFSSLSTEHPIERFETTNDGVKRYVRRRDNSEAMTYVSSHDTTDYDLAWLKSSHGSIVFDYNCTLRLADLFCGTGPMTLGVVEAGKALNIDIVPAFAIDFEPTASSNYALNFPTSSVLTDDVTKFLNGELGSAPTIEEQKLMDSVGNIDFVIAGPPCQGHSDLNNHTRRDDPRNLLLFRACRFIEIFKPSYFIIENVQGIRHDKHDVLGTAKEFLADLGYDLKENLLLASKYGVAQNRRRFLLVGSLSPLDIDLSHYEVKDAKGVSWAIDDLSSGYDTESTFNSSATHSKTNQARIDYLFEHNLYELPYQERPLCQRKPTNRYTSVYGRMYPDQPAPTITSGFGSIGQGRFCHPYFHRTLTPHEAARVQFIPDFFKFDKKLSRVALQKMIGNAVPPKLTYILTLEMLR